MSKQTTDSPFQALEEQAYHAFREWPIWLAIRGRELAAHLTAGHPPGAANPETAPTDRRGDPPLDARGN